MEAINRSGRPRNSRGGPMRPAPLASGGPAPGEVTCGGWGPHPQYSFLIKLASLSGRDQASLPVGIGALYPVRSSHPPTYAVDTYQLRPSERSWTENLRKIRVSGNDYCACAETILDLYFFAIFMVHGLTNHPTDDP